MTSKYTIAALYIFCTGILTAQISPSNDMRSQLEKTKSINIYKSLSFTNIVNNKVDEGEIHMGECTEKDFTFKIESANFNLLSPIPDVDYLAGKISAAEIETTIIQDCGQLGYKFKKGGLRLTLRNVTSNIHPILGGNIDFKGRKMWIKNITDVHVTKDSVSGVLFFDTYVGFKLNDVSLLVNESEIVKVTLESTSVAEFEYDLHSKEFVIVKGDFEINDFNISSTDKIILNDIEIDKPDLNLKNLKLSFDHGKVHAKMSVLSFDSPLINHNANPLFKVNLREPFNIESGEFEFDYNRTSFSMTGASVYDAHLSGGKGLYTDNKGMSVKFDSISAILDSFSMTEAAGSFLIRDANVSFVDKLNTINNGVATVNNLDFKVWGDKENLAGNGNIDIKDINITMASGIDISSIFNKCGVDKVPVALNGKIGGLKGPISITSGQLNISLKTNLVKANMKVEKYECVYVEELEVPVIYKEYVKISTCGFWILVPFGKDICGKLVEEIVEVINEVIEVVEVELKLTIQEIDADVDMTDVSVFTNEQGDIELCGGGIRTIDLSSLFLVSLTPVDVRAFGIEAQNILYPLIEAQTALLSQTILTTLATFSIFDFGLAEELQILESCE